MGLASVSLRTLPAARKLGLRKEDRSSAVRHS